MEFTKDIYFNDNLTSGKNATITYSGTLFQSGSEHVNLVFGFDDAWHYTTTLPMQKTDNGFTAKIEMRDYSTFNFCFSNEYNHWDNNNYSNYIAPILPKNEENVVEEKIDYGADYSSSIDQIIEEILGNTVQNNIATEKELDSVDKILESITEETLPEIEQLFNELFASEFETKATNSLDSVENTINSFDELFEIEPIESPIDTIDTNAELIKMFNELFESTTQPNFFENTIEKSVIEGLDQPVVKENKLNIASFNLDNLVSDLLDPVISQSVTPAVSEEISLFDDLKEHEDDEEETALTVIDSKDLLVSSRKLNSFYRFKKKIKIACYKLFVKIPKQLVKEFWFGQS